MIDEKVKQTILGCMYNMFKDKIDITYYNFMNTDNPEAYLDVRLENQFIEKIFYDRLKNFDLFQKYDNIFEKGKKYKLSDLITEKEFCQGATLFEILGIEAKYTK